MCIQSGEVSQKKGSSMLLNAPGYQVLIVSKKFVKAPVLRAGVWEIAIVDVQGAILAVEHGNRVHQVQHVCGEAIVLQLHHCAGLPCCDAAY